MDEGIGRHAVHEHAFAHAPFAYESVPFEQGNDVGEMGEDFGVQLALAEIAVGDLLDLREVVGEETVDGSLFFI